MAEFIGLYRGQTVSDAELVAICAEPRIVQKFFAELLDEDHDVRERKSTTRRGEHSEPLDLVPHNQDAT